MPAKQQPFHSPRHTNKWYSQAVVLAVLLLPAQIHPQNQPVVPVQQAAEPVIERIDINFTGPKSITPEYIQANIQISKGGPFSNARLDESIRSLYNTNLIEFIDAKVEPLPNNKVAIVLDVKSKYRIKNTLFRGNEKVKSDNFLNKDKEKGISSIPGEFLDELTLKKDQDLLLEMYRKKGYANVGIDYEVIKDADRATVVFNIDEGSKIKIKRVDFLGNSEVGQGRLRKVVGTKRWTPLSWFKDSGKFREETLTEDIDKIRDYYKEKGYLDVQVSHDDIQMEYPSPGKLLVTFKVKEGNQYSVGVTEIKGNSIFTTEEILTALKLDKGDVFAPAKVDSDQENIRKFYGSRGYLDAVVRANRRPNLDTRAIDLVYEIREGDKILLDSIKVEGNTKTKANVILRELALAPGDIFDLTRMESSRLRLMNTRFFEDVSIDDEETEVPGRRNMRITVKEARTGNLTFGAGFSSLEKAILFAEVTQGNFDLFNWRTFFQGDGQKFRLRAQLGSRSNEFVLYVEEPWLFEQRLAGGFELYRRQSEFYGPFSERRAGFEVFLRKVLFEMVEGRFSYNLDQVDIYDVDPNAPASIRNFVASSDMPLMVSKVTGTLLRDNRKGNILFPSSGSRVELRNELAGTVFGGDADYWKTELRTVKFIPTFESMEQNLSLMGRAGFISSIDDSTIPFFDRFFLGGPYTLRGFAYREVGPKEGGEPVGGNTYGMFSAEYTFKLADPLRFALFYDAGFVQAGEWDFDPSDYNSNWGLGLRIMVMGAPLRLDLGFPMATDQYNDQSHEFNFSFGTRF
jgi:outer membrane protein insertion porin family